MIGMLTNSFYDDSASAVFPHTANALRHWDGAELPNDATMATFVEELRSSNERDRAALAVAVRRMNFDEAGFRSLMKMTTRFATTFQEGSVRDGLIATDSRWGEPQTWAVVKRSTRAVTPFYLLSAVDLMQDRFR